MRAILFFAGLAALPLKVTMFHDFADCQNALLASGALAVPIKLMASLDAPPRIRLPPVIEITSAIKVLK